ncbi:hypothetical protein [Cryobacterium sp. PH31-O1]|uniref:hypothetical protein n=1 Tax=Cryobacterium sp. PH31-O1 TaxID=3046306 RepID=UPI0024BBB2AA|nr:hypothetical protein [Cryobacterium sp. PH31-O1]MDJ0337475.1 hypothetical protein [Cryobacterium sp. PH31-O1]
MALNYSFPGPSGLADSTALRKDLAGLVVRDSAGVVRGGVFPRHTGALITARSDMRVNVLPFEGVTVRGGPLFIANDGAMVSPLLDYAPSSNARIDVIYFKQNESSQADADNLPIIGVVTGNPSADPQKPALLIAGAEELGTVYVPSTAVATNSSSVVITGTHAFTAAAGGVVMVRSSAGYPVLPVYGQRIDDVARGCMLRWNGTGWAAGARSILGEADRSAASPYTLGATYAAIPSLSAVATTPAREVKVSATVMLANANSGADRTARLRVFCDGVGIGEELAGINIMLNGTGGATVTITAKHTPSAGAHTYTLQCLASTASAVQAFQGSLMVEAY